jgi:hypothetical protein
MMKQLHGSMNKTAIKTRCMQSTESGSSLKYEEPVVCRPKMLCDHNIVMATETAFIARVWRAVAEKQP